jgi:hypothetical protein
MVNEGKVHVGPDGNAVGIQEASNVTVEWNHVQRALQPIGVWANAQEVGSQAHDVRIRYNRIVDTVDPDPGVGNTDNGSAIALTSGDNVYDNEIAYNLIVTSQVGISAGGSGSDAGSANVFYNNTIVDSDTSIRIKTSNEYSVLLNNISHDPGTYHVLVEEGNVDTGVVLDDNLYFDPDNAAVFLPESGVPRTFAQWQANEGQDQNSDEGDPCFKDAANGNYHLRINSPALNSATYVDLTWDLDGDVVPYNGPAKEDLPDRGAYEGWSMPSC